MGIKAITSLHIDTVELLRNPEGLVVSNTDVFAGPWNITDNTTSSFYFLLRAQPDYNFFPTIPESAFIEKVTVSGDWGISLTDTSGTVIVNDFDIWYGPYAEGFEEYPPPLRDEIVTVGDNYFPGEYRVDSEDFSPVSLVKSEHYSQILFNDPTFLEERTILDIPSMFPYFYFFAYATGTANGPIGYLRNLNFRIDIEYDLEKYSWYIKPEEEVIAGRPVTVVPDGNVLQVPEGEAPPEGYTYFGTSDDFDNIYSWWQLPEDPGLYIYSPVQPGFNWIQLSGPPVCNGCTTITLGTLQVLVANASGVYTLQAEKTNDTLYTRSDFSTFVGTDDVAIPEPFGRTGFVP